VPPCWGRIGRRQLFNQVEHPGRDPLLELRAAPLGDLPIVVETPDHEGCKIIAAYGEFRAHCGHDFAVARQKLDVGGLSIIFTYITLLPARTRAHLTFDEADQPPQSAGVLRKLSHQSFGTPTSILASATTSNIDDGAVFEKQPPAATDLQCLGYQLWPASP